MNEREKARAAAEEIREIQAKVWDLWAKCVDDDIHERAAIFQLFTTALNERLSVNFNKIQKQW